jgi:hypothetical protein
MHRNKYWYTFSFVRVSSDLSQNASRTYLENLKGKDLSVDGDIVHNTLQDSTRGYENVDWI